jgi:hypothetical protein
MTNDGNPPDARVSSWTLATGTKPGERYVYGAPAKSNDGLAAPATRLLHGRASCR